MKPTFSKFIRFVFENKYRMSWLATKGFFNKMPDEKYLKMRFKAAMGRQLNLTNPKTFNEKLQWIKLYDRKPIYTTMVDKYLVKKYVSDRIGAAYVIPTLGVWDSFDEIDFESLPNQFVLKCTHDSGGLVIVRDKAKFDRNVAKQKIERSLKKNYFFQGREWPYKNVVPRIIAEKFVQDGNSQNLNVYKIFTFNGKPKLIQMIQGDKTEDETIDYFDVEWNLLELRQNFPNSKNPIKKPLTLNEMLALSERLAESENTQFLRTDFYEVNGKVLFSEFTFFSDSGFAKFSPDKWDYVLGSWIALPEKTV